MAKFGMKISQLIDIDLRKVAKSVKAASVLEAHVAKFSSKLWVSLACSREIAKKIPRMEGREEHTLKGASVALSLGNGILQLPTFPHVNGLLSDLIQDGLQTRRTDFGMSSKCLNVLGDVWMLETLRGSGC